jgi:hypothetical protein
MTFIGWMYDIAREQSPPEELLVEMLRRSAAAGYNAVGLYLEHRFAYPSAPWAAGPGGLTPEVVRRLQSRVSRPAGRTAPRIIPFLNTLGHMEGFIRSEGGQWLAEGEAGFGGLQMCATRPECAAFARRLVADALDTFDDEWVHLGGDETRQLGQCPTCAARVAQVGQGGLYGEYFGPLCRFVLERGHRPCLWGDMLLQRPEALDAIPRQTLIFDWQYFSRPRETTELFRRHGFDVVCCPSLQTYNAGWCFLRESQTNIDEHAADARRAGALGVLVTTWEFSFFTQYATALPLIYAAGRRLASGQDWYAALSAEAGEAYARAADILGNQIPAAAALLKPGTWRKLRDQLVIRQNPFYLWQAWRSAACGPVGDTTLRLCDEADALLSADAPLRCAVELHRVAVEWVRLVERTYQAYADGQLATAVDTLREGADLLHRLRPGLTQAADSGGSRPDVRRLEVLIDKVNRVAQRIGTLLPIGPYRPAFETLIHDAYVDGDQAAWRTAAYS